MATAAGMSAYPVDVQVDPPGKQSRLTILFRIFMIIPHAIALGLIGIGVSVVTVIAWFAILFTGKYPRGMADFVTGFLHWSVRLGAYGSLLTGAYPPFASGDQPYGARMLIQPQYEGRNRVTVFFRFLLVIPHIIALYFVQLAAGFVLLAGWLVGLFTGQLPAGIHNFLVGELRWSTRVNAYYYYLVDEYPPFSMN